MTVASVGRTSAVPANAAPASTAWCPRPLSFHRSVNPAATRPSTAVQKFGITCEPPTRAIHVKEKRKAATDAAIPMIGLQTARATPNPTAESTIR